MTHPSHKTRFSDSSIYDEVCTQCGATDAEMWRLNEPCKNVPNGIDMIKEMSNEDWNHDASKDNCNVIDPKGI